MSAARRWDDLVKAGQVPDDATQIAAIDEWLGPWAGQPKLAVVDQLLDDRLKLMKNPPETDR